jgi:hypothetical protein
MAQLVFLFFLPNRSKGTNGYGSLDRQAKDGCIWVFFINKKGYNEIFNVLHVKMCFES